jgi:hypothetical protein
MIAHRLPIACPLYAHRLPIACRVFWGILGILPITCPSPAHRLPIVCLQFPPAQKKRTTPFLRGYGSNRNKAVCGATSGRKYRYSSGRIKKALLEQGFFKTRREAVASMP